jgi:discoidin domain receptor family protein 2
VASRVRFLPHSDHPRTVCLRVEVYGCRYTAAVAAYAAPPGDEFSPGVRLEDVAYDGPEARVDGLLSGGLGLLTDGQLGGRLAFGGQQGLASGDYEL